MNFQQLKDALPDWARDIRLNLGTLMSEPCLTEQQRSGAFIAAAVATRHPDLIAAITAEFSSSLGMEAADAARAAATIMAMNNVYYRSTHALDGDYPRLPAKLRMTVIGKPGVEKADFELWCLAVSAINGCAKCTQSHERVVREAGLTQEQVQAAIRIAATVNAAATALSASAPLSSARFEAAA